MKQNKYFTNYNKNANKIKHAIKVQTKGSYNYSER